MAIFNESQMRRYQRHLSLKEVGFKGQMKLAASKVLCVGAGGLGSQTRGGQEGDEVKSRAHYLPPRFF